MLHILHLNINNNISSKFYPSVFGHTFLASNLVPQMDFLQSFLQYAITPIRKSKPKVQEFIYSDELNKKAAPVKVKKKVQFESKPLLQRDESKINSGIGNEKGDINSRGVAEKSGIQVKILMTKEEAVRLLSKCKDGGILEFKDVANELVRIPSNRVEVVSGITKDE